MIKLVNIGNSWDERLKEEFDKSYYINLRQFLVNEYKTKNIFPHMNNIFNALKLTSYEDVKVVILGQDPYHGAGQAHGLSFSVQPGVRIPPSLLNMYKELQDDLGCYIPNNGYLVPWAKQGVLLLNTVLTVREGEANSHRNRGWENFTDRVIELLNERKDPIIFLLWGNNAKEKIKLITNPRHYILTTVHPSPLSANRGFMGCKHFSKTNEILKSLGEKEIEWQIPNI
ncbi:MAG: uracil-DNA glycosylase [Clostridium sp.]